MAAFEFSGNVLGCDVSRYQPPSRMNYEKLVQEDGIAFAAVRFSVSDYYQDLSRWEHVKGFQDQDIPVIAYHVNRPKQDIDASLRNFEDAIGGAIESGDLEGVVLDSELAHDYNGVLQPNSVIANDCLQHARAINQMHPNAWLYSRKTFWDYFVGGDWAPSYLAAWMAHYYWPYVKYPWLVNGYSEYEIWQWTSARNPEIKGYDGNLDLNWMTLAAYNARFKPVVVNPIEIEIIVPKGANVIVTER